MFSRLKAALSSGQTKLRLHTQLQRQAAGQLIQKVLGHPTRAMLVLAHECQYFAEFF
jgi:hypothetical protein